VTTTTLPARPVERSSADQPVLVVVDLDRPGGTAPDPAVLAADAFNSPVELLVLAPRIGFSTDAALVAGAHRRVREESERALPALRRLVPQLGGSAEVVWYARTPIGNPREQARRAARRVARRRHARAVILPLHLEA
jgi:hypothetical protein